MHHHSETSKTTRLAQNDWIAVDLCSCGALHLHIGALSLRLQPEAITSLIEVLQVALAKRQRALPAAPEALRGEASAWGARISAQRRGKA